MTWEILQIRAAMPSTAGLAGGAGDLLPRGDTYRESSGQSEYGERAGEVLGEEYW